MTRQGLYGRALNTGLFTPVTVTKGSQLEWGMEMVVGHPNSFLMFLLALSTHTCTHPPHTYTYTHVLSHIHIHMLTPFPSPNTPCWTLKAQIINSVGVKPVLGIEDRTVTEKSYTDTPVGCGHYFVWS